MKKVMILVAALVFVLGRPCSAIEKDAEELLSVISLMPQTTTQNKVTRLLGTPSRIEENKKWIWWYYHSGQTNVVISWNKKSSLPEKISFKSDQPGTGCFDKSMSKRLKSGETNLNQALHMLGTPKDMTIRPNKQEVYYAYENKMLRLFFRDHKLVDYCLY